MFKRMLFAAALLVFAGTGCTTYVRPAPPPLRVEVRGHAPHKHSRWMPGHWKWKNRRVGYVWVPGHWQRVR